jgi:hypothetical protein
MHLVKIVFALFAVGGSGYALFKLQHDEVPLWLKVVGFFTSLATIIMAITYLPQAIDGIAESATKIGSWLPRIETKNSQTPTSTPPGVTPPKPPPPETAPKRPFRVVDVSDGFLQIRNGPGPTYQETANMPLGAIALVGRCVPLDGGWKPFCEVEWQGVSGWASLCCMAELEETTQFSYRVTQNLRA